MPNRFDACTGITIGQIPFNCFAHLGAQIITANKFVDGSSTRVASCGVIKVGMDDLPMQVLII